MKDNMDCKEVSSLSLMTSSSKLYPILKHFKSCKCCSPIDFLRDIRTNETKFINKGFSKTYVRFVKSLYELNCSYEVFNHLRWAVSNSRDFSIALEFSGYISEEEAIGVSKNIIGRDISMSLHAILNMHSMYHIPRVIVKSELPYNLGTHMNQIHNNSIILNFAYLHEFKIDVQNLSLDDVIRLISINDIINS